MALNKGLLGKKIGMTQLFDVNGKQIGVTVVELGPCVVSQIKTKENDGYEAVQLGYGDVTPKHVNKPQDGHFKKADAAPKRHLQEFKFEDISAYTLGGVLKADVFAVGDIVDVAGTSKGKGFQGTIKRFGNHRIKETHGSGPVHRHAGSMGACSSPSRIYKGKKMPGHMGSDSVTVQNLEVVKIDVENNLIAIKGAVPGPNGSIVRVVNAVKGTQLKGKPAEIINQN
jgi:large subunit ribosomal protein L3